METDENKASEGADETAKVSDERGGNAPMNGKEFARMQAWGAADRLRADLQAVRPAILEGTVVKFCSRGGSAQIDYTYAALFVNAQWYLTGSERSPFPRSMNHVDFLALLGRSTIHDIQTATDWEAVG